LLARELPLDPSPVDGGTVLDDLMNIVKNFPDETPNRRLALGCIEADVCKTNRKFASLQHFSKSTIFAHSCTAPSSTFAEFWTASISYFGYFQNIVEFKLKYIIFRRDFYRCVSELREIPDSCRKQCILHECAEFFKNLPNFGKFKSKSKFGVTGSLQSWGFQLPGTFYLPFSNWTPSICWRSVRYPHPSTRSQG
jgi:hypothetical protein